MWASALIVAVALLLLAGLLALLGKRQTARATPLAPREAISGLRTDVERIKESAHR
ncbi:phage holin family protein [Streptomyces sp. NPDC048845]|uniref:phage holin family protein n=1 Tax=Streptomyces sp. NPDC048845 TaxID=3155390 RepID=UPI0034494CC1